MAEERLRLLDRISVLVEENLCPQPVELGIGVVLSLLLGLRYAECQSAEGFVVMPGLPEALGEYQRIAGAPIPLPIPASSTSARCISATPSSLSPDSTRRKP